MSSRVYEFKFNPNFEALRRCELNAMYRDEFGGDWN